MSGIAEILVRLGFRVSGSDLKKSGSTDHLEKQGVPIFEGHSSENLPSDAALLVYSSAVRDDNPEIVEARSRGIPVIRRAEVLAELMRLRFGVAVAGSHGKTTTTSMVGAVLDHGELDPTVIVGGQLKSKGSGGRLGESEYLVAETDESDRSFLLLKPTVAVVTNIDSEHLTAYASLADLEQSFESFVRSVPFYGLAILCVDDARVRDLASRYDRRKVTYGISPDADIQAHHIEHNRGTSRYELHIGGATQGIVNLPMPGRHMVVNSLAAIAVGLEFGLSIETIIEALATFEGVKRRMEVMGEERGVIVINDYGHHPSEIRATIEAVRSGWLTTGGKLRVVFEPHRYTRTRDCFAEFLDSFHGADEVVLSEIYAASEDPIAGISGSKLTEAINHPAKSFFSSIQEIAPALHPRLNTGDVVLCMGAGSIGSLAETIVKELRASDQQTNQSCP